jgi:hypothetical protein
VLKKIFETQRLEVSGAVRPLYWPLGVKGIINEEAHWDASLNKKLSM